jgi:hypothetical protein
MTASRPGAPVRSWWQGPGAVAQATPEADTGQMPQAEPGGTDWATLLFGETAPAGIGGGQGQDWATLLFG